MVPFGISAYRNRNAFSMRGVSLFSNAPLRDTRDELNGLPSNYAEGSSTLRIGACPVRPMYMHLDTRCYPDLRLHYAQRPERQTAPYMVLPTMYDRGIQTDV